MLRFDPTDSDGIRVSFVWRSSSSKKQAPCLVENKDKNKPFDPGRHKYFEFYSR